MSTGGSGKFSIDLSLGRSFEQYVELWDEDRKNLLLRQSEITKESAEFLREVEAFRGAVILAVFSKVGCPDCMFLAPFLKRLEEKNPRVRVLFFKREDHLKLVLAATGVTRVPTVLPFTNEGVLLEGAFIGHPRRVDEEWDAASERGQRTAIMKAYRSGEDYLPDLEAELLALLRSDVPFRPNAFEEPRVDVSGFSAQIAYLPYPDPGTAADFYERHLRLELVQATDSLRLYRISGKALLGIVKGAVSSWGRSDASVEHPDSVAVTLVTDDAIGWHDRLRVQGVPVGDYAFMYREAIPFRRFLVNDPEGYTLEVREFLDDRRF